MLPIKEVYPPCEDGRYPNPYDYQPLLNSFGYEIVLQVDDEDYQGDSRLLLKDNQRYGYLIFGWGSCSGCDALQDCGTYQEVEELRQRLHDSIEWFDTADECLSYFRTHDLETKYFWHCQKGKEFIEGVITYLTKQIEGRQGQ